MAGTRLSIAPQALTTYIKNLNLAKYCVSIKKLLTYIFCSNAYSNVIPGFPTFKM